METIVASVIAAVVALAVTIVDRLWVSRDEPIRWERADRRHVYAIFIRAAIDNARGRTVGALTPEERIAMSGAYGELLLVAPEEVRRAAADVYSALLDVRQDDATTMHVAANARERFVTAARVDLGLSPNTLEM